MCVMCSGKRVIGIRHARLIAMELISPNVSSSFYNYQLRLHRHHEDLLGRLVDAVACRSADARRIWDELEDSLRSHMEAEERYVLPSFARTDRDEALALVRDHNRIREQLLEIGIAIDLHEAGPATRFVQLLRDHAAREDKLLYRWADRELDPKLAERVTAQAAP